MHTNPLYIVRITGPEINTEQLPAHINILSIRRIYYAPIGIYIGIFLTGLGVCECIYYFIDNSFKYWEMILYLYISVLGTLSFIGWCLWYCCRPSPSEQLENIEQV